MKKIMFSMLLFAMLSAQGGAPQSVKFMINNTGDYTVIVNNEEGKEIVRSAASTPTDVAKNIVPGSTITIQGFNQKELDQGIANYTRLHTVTIAPDANVGVIQISVAGLFGKKLKVRMW